MIKKTIITIGGKPGSGKSATAKALAKKMDTNTIPPEIFLGRWQQRGDLLLLS